jgi:ABC-type Co2+ transport system permease subunit
MIVLLLLHVLLSEHHQLLVLLPETISPLVMIMSMVTRIITGAATSTIPHPAQMTILLVLLAVGLLAASTIARQTIVTLTVVEMIVPTIVIVQEVVTEKTILLAIHEGGITAVIVTEVRNIIRRVVEREAFETTAVILRKDRNKAGAMTTMIGTFDLKKSSEDPVRKAVLRRG